MTLGDRSMPDLHEEVEKSCPWAELLASSAFSVGAIGLMMQAQSLPQQKRNLLWTGPQPQNFSHPLEAWTVHHQTRPHPLPRPQQRLCQCFLQPAALLFQIQGRLLAVAWMHLCRQNQAKCWTNHLHSHICHPPWHCSHLAWGGMDEESMRLQHMLLHHHDGSPLQRARHCQRYILHGQALSFPTSQ